MDSNERIAKLKLLLPFAPDSEDEIAAAGAVMGRKGGATKSDAKSAAARENGRKGGRPRKYHAVRVTYPFPYEKSPETGRTRKFSSIEKATEWARSMDAHISANCGNGWPRSIYVDGAAVRDWTFINW